MSREVLQEALELLAVATFIAPKLQAKRTEVIIAGLQALERPAQRKPLTDRQILADKTLRYYFGQNGGAGPVSKQGRKVVDAIEVAHGIKENT